MFNTFLWGVKAPNLTKTIALVAVLAGLQVRATAETIHYTDSGSATQAEIARTAQLNYANGQSHDAMRSVLGTPNEIYQPENRPGYFSETYRVEGADYGRADCRVQACNSFVEVEYTYQGDRWVTTSQPSVWGGAPK
jgi:hypothetical protein